MAAPSCSKQIIDSTSTATTTTEVYREIQQDLPQGLQSGWSKKKETNRPHTRPAGKEICLHT